MSVCVGLNNPGCVRGSGVGIRKRVKVSRRVILVSVCCFREDGVVRLCVCVMRQSSERTKCLFGR